MKAVNIGKYRISPGQPCFIIAEAGVNHNGDINLAHQLIDIAVKAGVDAVKFQSFITEELITRDAPKADYQVQTTGNKDSQYSMLKSLELGFDQQLELKTHCDQAGILFLSTPYDPTSVDLLDKMEVAGFKIASTDTTNLPFLKYVAEKGKPVILSTGMSTLGEVEQAVEVIRSTGQADNLVLLHCTSEYPAKIEEANLKAIITLQQAFNCPVGFSDHTQGIGASPWAVAIGACVVEKHFTLDHNMIGPDHRASLEPDELTALVREIRLVESALGDGVKRLMPSEISNKTRMQKSLMAKRQLDKGERITAQDITLKRPGDGLPATFFTAIVGRKTSRIIAKDEQIGLAAIDWES